MTGERFQIMSVVAPYSQVVCEYTIYDQKMERDLLASRKKSSLIRICNMLNKQELIRCD